MWKKENLVPICLILADKVQIQIDKMNFCYFWVKIGWSLTRKNVISDRSIQHWAYFVHFSCKRPPPVSDYLVLNQGWPLTGELTVFSLTRESKKIKVKSPDWRRAYICPSDRKAGQMRNRLGYRGTPWLTRLHWQPNRSLYKFVVNKIADLKESGVSIIYLYSNYFHSNKSISRPIWNPFIVTQA